MTNHDRLIGEVAATVGTESWRLRRLIQKGLIPEPRRIGRYRVFDESEIPAIRDAAREAGYLYPHAEAAVTSA